VRKTEREGIRRMLKRQLKRAHTLFVSFYWLRNAGEKCSALKTSGPRHHQLCFPAEVDCDSPASLRLTCSKEANARWPAARSPWRAGDADGRATMSRVGRASWRTRAMLSCVWRAEDETHMCADPGDEAAYLLWRGRRNARSGNIVHSGAGNTEWLLFPHSAYSPEGPLLWNRRECIIVANQCKLDILSTKFWHFDIYVAILN
jgi:hypothetical protein